jgi:hypothetical protein
MLQLDVLSCPLHLLKLLTLWKRWRPIKLGTRNVNPRKKEIGMHQLKEVDMLSAKMDLLMKRLEEQAPEKKEVMQLFESRMTCEECGNIGHC